MADLRAVRGCHGLLDPDDALGVRYAGRRPQEYRRVELLGELEGELDEVLCLLAVGRLQHGDLRELRVVAVVLLVLRAVKRRVIGRDDHERPVRPGVAHREERVRSHIDAHVLHHRHGTCPCKGGPDGHLEPDFFIGRPLGIDALVLCEGLQDFRARRPRVARAEGGPALPGASCNRLVSRHEFLHGSSPSPFIPAARFSA